MKTCCLCSFHPNSSLICQIMKEIQEHKIKIYEFPDTEDEEDNKLIRKIKVINYTVCVYVCANF